MRGFGPFLGDALRLARPYFTSEERRSACGLLAAIIALNLSLVGMDVVLSFWNRAFFNALQDKDWDAFIGLLFLYRRSPDGIMPGFCAVAALYVVVAVYRTYLNQWLRIRWRRWMTNRLLASWLADRVYYRLSLQAPVTAGASPAKGDAVGTDNPDQRIAEDLNSFVTDGLSLSLDLMSNIVSLFSFVVILWSLSGPLTVYGVSIPGYMVWVALVYAAAGTLLAHLIGRPLAALNFRQQRVEADFRFALMRLRENVEGVALYHGEAEERRGLDHRFRAVIANWWAIMRRTKSLNALVAGYGQIAVVFPIVVAAPRYFSGALTLGGLTQTSGAFGQVQGAMSWFVNSYASIAAWTATVERLATFQRSIEAARAAGPGAATAPSDSADWRLDHLTLRLPDGKLLLDQADLTLHRGQSTVVTGRSGSGKSTLFRALAGIWPFATGTLDRPAGRSLFLPQRPYIPLGTLRHAVCYPAPTADFDDATVHQALHDVGLAEFADRLDLEDNWAQRLSGGEQQRLAVARALLTRPDWLFLDEATASLDPEAEAALYAVLQHRLPDTTLVSIAHRPSVAALHQRHLVFDPAAEGGARLTPAPR